jgi:hypothetical protein
MDSSPYLLSELLDELQKLNPTLTGDTDHPVGARLSLRAGDGRLVGGDAILSEKAIHALLDAVKAVNAYASQDVPDEGIDPLLEADFEEYCIGLPVEHLLALAAQDPKQAVADFDAATSDVDGEL